MNTTKAALAGAMSMATALSGEAETTEKLHPVAGPVATVSNASFDTTRDQLRSAIEKRGITIFAEIDHAAGARSVDLPLEANTLFIFGNPMVGTPLMQANPELGLELPMKALVYSEGSDVFVLVTDIRGVAENARISETLPVLDKIETMLTGLVAEAIEAPVQ